MNILLVYATYSSGTHEASYVAKHALETKNHTVTLQQAKDTKPEDFEPYDLVLLASPSWEIDGKDGQPHIDMGNLMQKFEGKKFEGKKFAIMGLGEIHYARFCGAVDHIEAFVKNLGGTLVTESLRINRYPFDEDKNNERIVGWTQRITV